MLFERLPCVNSTSKFQYTPGIKKKQLRHVSFWLPWIASYLVSQALNLFFNTLYHYPYLALLVHHIVKLLRQIWFCLPQNCSILDIENAPYSVTNKDENLLRLVLGGLKNCINLRSCTWPSGSLNDNILEVLHQYKSLRRRLHLIGQSRGNYDPQLLLRFTELHHISLLLPTLPVVHHLKPWLSATGATLRNLVLACDVRLDLAITVWSFTLPQMTSILTDETLEEIAPSLVNLEYFDLNGCLEVTHHGVWAIVSSSTNGLRGLTLGGVSHKFVS